MPGDAYEDALQLTWEPKGPGLNLANGETLAVINISLPPSQSSLPNDALAWVLAITVFQKPGDMIDFTTPLLNVNIFCFSTLSSLLCVKYLCQIRHIINYQHTWILNRHCMSSPKSYKIPDVVARSNSMLPWHHPSNQVTFQTALHAPSHAKYFMPLHIISQVMWNSKGHCMPSLESCEILNIYVCAVSQLVRYAQQFCQEGLRYSSHPRFSLKWASNIFEISLWSGAKLHLLNFEILLFVLYVLISMEIHFYLYILFSKGSACSFQGLHSPRIGPSL